MSLLGESLPVVKTAPESSAADKRFEAEKEKRHVIYSGTRVLSIAEDKATLTVVRTGFQTAKGSPIQPLSTLTMVSRFLE